MPNFFLELKKKLLQKKKESADDLIDIIVGLEDNLGFLDPITQLLQIKQITKQKEEKEKLLLQLQKEIAKLEREIANFDISSKLTTAFRLLNYDEQRKEFEKVSAVQHFGAFLIQGSHHCGQDLLLERFQNYLSIEEDTTEKVEIDFSSNVTERPTPANIWQKIKDAMQEVQASSNNEIAREIFSKYYEGKKKNLLFIFKNTQVLQPEYNVAVIKAFWFNFLSYLPELKNPAAEAAERRKILLFLLDKGAYKTCPDGRLECRKLLSYVQYFGTDKPEDKATYLLPIIKPVDANELDLWRGAHNLPGKLGLQHDVFQQLVTDKGAFVLSAIEKICQYIHMPEIYSSNFKNFE